LLNELQWSPDREADSIERTGGRRTRGEDGNRSRPVTSDTYTHVLVDGRELDYAALLARPKTKRSGDAEVLP
jgi:hypothetical protein